MKNILFSVLVAVFLLGASNALLAQTEEENATAETEDMRRQVRRGFDPNRPPAQGDATRQQRRERALTAREKRRERMMKMREMRVKQLQEAGRARAAREGREPVKGGVDHEQQIKQLETQMNREEAKHNQRVARLNRIKELAEQEGSEDVLGRIEKLLQKEQRRYSFKRQRMDMKMRTFKRIKGRKESLGAPGEPPAGPGRRGPGGRPPRGPGARRPIKGGRQQPSEEVEQ
ncbi:MAG: hypothetical protein ACYTEQ_22320 [Planctomycetota bacterium]|jgi:hypothetical protein